MFDKVGQTLPEQMLPEEMFPGQMSLWHISNRGDIADIKFPVVDGGGGI